MEQPRIDDNEPSTSDTGDKDVDTDEEGTWFWNKSANESESDSKCSGYSDEEGDLGPEESRRSPLAKTTKGDKIEQRWGWKLTRSV